ncbi:unnamed protein product [Caenorhabditis sp. 36 PRJEB53466]|nr:unnamed protein product [Caenorhabditis sp. 36 PRJEB53466]
MTLKGVSSLLILLGTIGAVVAGSRLCPQCTHANFINNKLLMQNKAQGQYIGWVLDWEGTDCSEGILNFVECMHACLCIEIENVTKSGNLEYVGLMLDCSTDLIWETPDLPSGTDWTNFLGELVHSNVREGRKISYHFSSEPTILTDEFRNELKRKSPPSIINVKNGLILAALAVSVLVSSMCVICLCKRMCNRRRPEEAGQIEMEMAVAGGQNANGAEEMDDEIREFNDRCLYTFDFDEEHGSSMLSE